MPKVNKNPRLVLPKIRAKVRVRAQERVIKNKISEQRTTNSEQSEESLGETKKKI